MKCGLKQLKLAKFLKFWYKFAPKGSGGAKVGPAGARAPAVKPGAPADELYNDVDHKNQ